MTLQDVTIASLGLGAPSIAAFTQGRVNAAGLAGSAITMAKHRYPRLLFLADARSAEGVKQIYGLEVYPAHDLLAQTEWLRNNADTARRLTSAVMRAMRYMQEHSPDEIRAHMPAQYRLQDERADVDALRATVPMLSRNGRVTPEEAQATKNVLAVSDERVRTAQIDLSQVIRTSSSLLFLRCKLVTVSLFQFDILQRLAVIGHLQNLHHCFNTGLFKARTLRKAGERST